MTELLTLARDAGFEETTPLQAAQLVFRPEVRDMCRADRCSSYGKSWCCPPACPSLEEMTRRMWDYGQGVLVETVGTMADDFDYEAMMEAEARHKERFRQLTQALYHRYGRENVLRQMHLSRRALPLPGGAGGVHGGLRPAGQSGVSGLRRGLLPRAPHHDVCKLYFPAPGRRGRK